MHRSYRIMNVEDEPTVRLVFRAALESNEFLLTTAEDGETALRFQREAPTDLILLDLQMPGLGGLEVLRRLRGAGSDVPVVIVSAHDGEANVREAIRLGAVGFLPKPPTPATLRKVVADALASTDNGGDRP